MGRFLGLSLLRLALDCVLAFGLVAVWGGSLTPW